MGFWRRFKLYLIGVGLGLIAVWIMFSQSERPSWTPEGRVLLFIDSSHQSYSERALCQLKCLDLDSAQLAQIQKQASVDFSESNTRKKPCPVYQLNSVIENSKYRLSWEVCENEEEVELLAIQLEGRRCDCWLEVWSLEFGVWRKEEDCLDLIIVGFDYRRIVRLKDCTRNLVTP